MCHGIHTTVYTIRKVMITIIIDWVGDKRCKDCEKVHEHCNKDGLVEREHKGTMGVYGD